MKLGTQNLENRKLFTQHLVHRAYKKKKTRRLILVGLTLTSMVDMFSLLVIFLLQNFSTSPELLFVAKGVTLPLARTGNELRDAPVLSLSTEGVFLDQKYVGKTEELLKKPDELLKRLNALKEMWRKTHPKEEFKGEISLQAHSEISSVIVSQFMGMLPSQEYGSILLAVTPSGGT